MRVLAAAATIAACVLVSIAANAGDRATESAGAAAAAILKQAPSLPKPGVEVRDTCRWANDNECDEPDIGTGACQLGTDVSDCRAVRAGDDDSCRWANDNECDEPHLGTGACAQGADFSDCGEIASLRNQTDSCATAFNDVCDEPGQGNGLCAPRTDRSDCIGRERPLTINDHFFGRDDRVLVQPSEAPWRYVGRLAMDSGVGCSATLIARDVILTAANCLFSNERLLPQGRFVSSAEGLSARLTAYQISRRYNSRRHNTTDRVDGHDWALMRIDQPLGDEVGYATIRNLIGESRDRALQTDLMQAGYGWDTGQNLAANLRCRMVAAHQDNTFAHECDTTWGDGGSALFAAGPSGFEVIGVDSRFRRNPGGPQIYIAVGAAAFQPHVADFIAGRNGRVID